MIAFHPVNSISIVLQQFIAFMMFSFLLVYDLFLLYWISFWFIMVNSSIFVPMFQKVPVESDKTDILF